jgi:hypothetical protein
VTLERRIGAVFDCNTYLQAVARETGPAFACLEAFARDEFDLFVSQAILDDLIAADGDYIPLCIEPTKHVER